MIGHRRPDCLGATASFGTCVAGLAGISSHGLIVVASIDFFSDCKRHGGLSHQPRSLVALGAHLVLHFKALESGTTAVALGLRCA